jgi:hypothetical protein
MRRFAESSARDQVLRELEKLAQGKHQHQQTPLTRFSQCPDWQKAAEAILQALRQPSQRLPGARLSPPPGWLPPLN